MRKYCPGELATLCMPELAVEAIVCCSRKSCLFAIETYLASYPIQSAESYNDRFKTIYCSEAVVKGLAPSSKGYAEFFGRI